MNKLTCLPHHKILFDVIKDSKSIHAEELPVYLEFWITPFRKGESECAFSALYIGIFYKYEMESNKKDEFLNCGVVFGEMNDDRSST